MDYHRGAGVEVVYVFVEFIEYFELFIFDVLFYVVG